MNGLNIKITLKGFDLMQVFLSCVKTKNNVPCKAQDMYTSDLFKKSLAYALTLTDSKKIFILSAKYGVLRLNDEIKPYNQTLNNMTKDEQRHWAYRCYKQSKALKINFNEKTVFLCGVNYRKYYSQLFKDYEIPLQGVSFGNQLKFYKERLNDAK